jgi:hypothetical protein
MPILVDILRAHIMPGLTTIEEIPQMTFRGWIANKSYKMTSPLYSKEFSLDVYNHETFLLPYAYDINRMAASSFESMHGISPENGLPKSVGWLIIRSYYSAYFSMHALLRLFGISCSQFDANEARAVTDVARLYCLENGNIAASGYYKCQYNVQAAKVYCKQLSNTHQDVWKSFYDLIDDLATKIATSQFRKKDRDYAIEYLFNLREGLSFRKTLNGGNWLSKVRNEVNYTHSMGAWFPYSNSPDEHEKMFRLTRLWKQSPEDMMQSHLNQCEHILFIGTCVSIVSLCHAILLDLHSINGNTFLKYGAIRLSHQLN